MKGFWKRSKKTTPNPPTTILTAIISIVLADYLLERGLNFINSRSIATQLPDEVKGIYSEEKYQRYQEYKEELFGTGHVCSIRNSKICYLLQAVQIAPITPP